MTRSDTSHPTLPATVKFTPAPPGGASARPDRQFSTAVCSAEGNIHSLRPFLSATPYPQKLPPSANATLPTHALAPPPATSPKRGAAPGPCHPPSATPPLAHAARCPLTRTCGGRSGWLPTSRAGVGGLFPSSRDLAEDVAVAVREEFGVAHHLLGLVLDEHLLEAGVTLALLEHLEPRPAPAAPRPCPPRGRRAATSRQAGSAAGRGRHRRVSASRRPVREGVQGEGWWRGFRRGGM